MAPRSRRRTGDGFSLVDLQPTLTSAVSSIADELSSQGVDIDTNSLLMGIQQIVNGLVMNNPGVMMASDDAKPPYNLAADLLAVAYNHFHGGNKREAVKGFLVACELDDTESLVEAFLMMNNKSDNNKHLVAAEGDDDAGAEDDDDDGDMSDEEVDALIDENEGDNSSDNEDDDSQDNDDAPMGGTSSDKTTTASDNTPENRARRVLAAKMSSSGDKTARQQAMRLLGG